MDATAPNEEFTSAEQAGDGQLPDRFDNLEDALAAFDDDEDPDTGEPTSEPDEDDDEAELVADEDSDESVTVDLEGEKVSLKELKAGYFRQADYTRKTTEVAQERKAVEQTKADLSERTAVVETALQNLSGFLQNLIPAEPPLNLARTDPGQYQYQRAMRESAIAELGQLVAIKGPVEQTKSQVSEAEFREYRDREQAALLKALPALADPARKAAFEQSVGTAAKAFGFSDDEIAATLDHRVLQLVHYARLGKKAEENRNAAKQRIGAEAPKQTKAKSAPAPVDADYQKAKRRFQQTRSIRDAAKLDFD